LVGSYPSGELVLRRVGAILSRPVDRVSVAPGQLAPCLVGKLGLRLSLTPDELELADIHAASPNIHAASVLRLSLIGAISGSGSKDTQAASNLPAQ
jgi:hypothetical protein